MNKLCCEVLTKGYCKACGEKWCNACAERYNWSPDKSPHAAIRNPGDIKALWQCPVANVVMFGPSENDTLDINSSWTFVPYDI